MKRIVGFVGIGFLCIAAAAAQAAKDERLPPITGTTLTNQKVALPDTKTHRAMVLIFGFSHKAADETEAWGKRVGADFGTNPKVAYFIIPELEGVPGMVKPMILHGMRRDVPADEKAHFLPIYEHEKELKEITGYSQEESAYVVVADAERRIAWRTAGAVNDDRYSAMKQALDSILRQ